MYSVQVENEKEINRFREAEKYYAGKLPSQRINPRDKRKRDIDPVDYTNVIDFTNIESNTEENKKLIVPVDINHKPSKYFEPIKNAYALKNVEGLIFVPNPFTVEQQKFWVKQCITKYTVGNPTNISNLHGPEYIWQKWEPSKMDELRWASLGYHFQWTPRIYSDEFKGEFPEELGEYISDMASQFNYNMKAEAAIVNFYPHKKCCMGGHLDDAEDDMTKPIVSTSFGNTVIFLIGGKTRDVKPTALYIRSGDVVIMGGYSRYCYHGIPKMLRNSAPSFFKEDNPSNEWKEVQEYILKSRININARQVRFYETTK